MTNYSEVARDSDDRHIATHLIGSSQTKRSNEEKEPEARLIVQGKAFGLAQKIKSKAEVIVQKHRTFAEWT